MTRILIHLAFALALLPSTVHAFWGPKNFDDCILRNMKGVTSDDAAGMIYESCRAKFPTADEIKEKIDAIKAKERYKLCGANPDDRNLSIFFSIFGERAKKSYRARETINNILGEVMLEEWNLSAKTLKVTNRNTFQLGGIELGIGASFGSKKEDYAVVSYCYGLIPPGGYGVMQCTEVPRKLRGLRAYATGYMPAYSKFDDSLLFHMEYNGLCN